MKDISGYLMLKDTAVAEIDNGNVVPIDIRLMPLYLQRKNDFEGWLKSRAIDSHRTNSRLLKKVLRLRERDDVHTVLAAHAANLTDKYWFRENGSTLTYDDVKFTDDAFASLAICGDPDAFSLSPSPTPELTNTGSFEKCWRLVDGEWWLYKSENDNEYFSELFVYEVGKLLDFSMAHYEMAEKYIRTKNFVDGTNLFLEPISAIMDGNDDYCDCFNALYEISPELAADYLRIIWLDTLCFNMDRHTENFGLLRDASTGKIVSLAPNYDNNVALIARGYMQSEPYTNDLIMKAFTDFIAENDTARNELLKILPRELTAHEINACYRKIPIKADEEYVTRFVLSRQKQMFDTICHK